MWAHPLGFDSGVGKTLAQKSPGCGPTLSAVFPCYLDADGPRNCDPKVVSRALPPLPPHVSVSAFIENLLRLTGCSYSLPSPSPLPVPRH